MELNFNFSFYIKNLSLTFCSIAKHDTNKISTLGFCSWSRKVSVKLCGIRSCNSHFVETLIFYKCASNFGCNLSRAGLVNIFKTYRILKSVRDDNDKAVITRLWVQSFNTRQIASVGPRVIVMDPMQVGAIWMQVHALLARVSNWDK